MMANPAVVKAADILVERYGLEGALREAVADASVPRQSGDPKPTRGFRDGVVAELRRRWERADHP